MTALPDTPQALMGFDTETYLMGENNLAPTPVCLTACMDVNGERIEAITKRGDADFDDWIGEVYNPENGFVKIACNTAYDLAVLMNHRPEWGPLIWHGLANNQFTDVIVREKLLALATTGDPEFWEAPDGRQMKAGYALADLAKKYLGVDLSDEKKDEDSWRKNYQLLDDVPLAEWPQEAVSYAVDDARYVVDIYKAQEAKRQEVIKLKGPDPFVQEYHRTALSFSLYLMSMRGLHPNAQGIQKLKDMLEEELKPENLNLLFGEGILRPAVPGRPYANGATNEDGTPKMTAGKAESLNKTRLHEFVRELAKEDSRVQIKRNEPTDAAIKKYEDLLAKADKGDGKAKRKLETSPQIEEAAAQGSISVDADWLAEYASFHPVLEQYAHRQKLQKLLTTELPRMHREDGTIADTVHPNFNVVLKTGRTSSYASKIYPSANGQNFDARVRNCYEAREGFVFLSVDYNQMELATLAQRCLDVCGFSVHADRINQETGDPLDNDCHTYLGSQLAYHLDKPFGEACRKNGATDPQDVFRVFKEMKKTDQKFFGHYRKFAKPTGLGYPGGLGPDTMITYAKGTYGVEIEDRDVAVQLREIWRETYPEMVPYFRHINERLVDPFNQKAVIDKKTGEQRIQNKYHHTTPGGLYVCNLDYCSVANGFGLQAISADGATRAVVDVARRCYDPYQDSILYGNAFPVDFIHDEIFLEVRDDLNILDEVAKDVTLTMVKAMQTITPDVRARAEACYMRVWDKDAKPVYDEKGRLTVWEPA